MIRIIFADDHPVVRRGLRQLVADQSDMTIVGEASNAEEMLALLRTHACDVVVTDISMRGRSGLSALKEVKREYPKLPVLVLSMHPEDQYGIRAIKLGASGYVSKESAVEELVQAIRRIVAGERHLSSALADRLALNLPIDSGRPLHEVLSLREHQVLCMIATGNSLTEIADELGLSLQTVSTYRARIVEKMGMESNEQIIHYVFSNGLMDPSMPAQYERFSRQSEPACAMAAA